MVKGMAIPVLKPSILAGIKTAIFGETSEYSQAWQPAAGGGFEKANGEPFELHLPTQVESIVKHFKGLVPQHSFDQFVYLFKAHGSTFASAKFDYDLLTLMGQSLPSHIKANHVFLFDPHGPDKNKPYASELYLPYWTKFTGCRILSKNVRVDSKYLALNPAACSCRDLLEKRNKPIGTFELAPEGIGADSSWPFGENFIFDLGTSKSLFYRSFEPINGRAPSVKIPEGVHQVGGAVSYDMTSPPVKGIEQWSLPFGKYPTLIVLDSCKGHPDVFRLIEAHDTKGVWRDKNRKRLPVAIW